MKLLFLGASHAGASALDRARALIRLGHEVEVFDPDAVVPGGRLWRGMHQRTGYRFCRRQVGAAVRQYVGNRRFDLVWVDGGRTVGPMLIEQLRRVADRIINYNLDDPFGTCDGREWDTYLESVPWYDAVCVVREENVPEALRLGARRVLRVWRGHDPLGHAAVQMDDVEREAWTSEVLFVGSWRPERGPFLEELLERGVPLSIRGNGWQLAPEWPKLRNRWRGPAVFGAEYVKAVQCSRVSLGLLSRSHRDRHAQRSAEIPFMGGLFCAQDTDEHRVMYEPGREAVLWSDAAKCAEACHWLLEDDETRAEIARAGRARVLGLGLSNDEMGSRILAEVFEPELPARPVTHLNPLPRNRERHVPFHPDLEPLVHR